jgi:hypothetical protein
MAKSIKKRIADKIKSKVENKINKVVSSNLDILKRLSDNNSQDAKRS